MRDPIKVTLTKAQWIEQYGGQALLDREGFEVVECKGECQDSICHGWKVVTCSHPRPRFRLGPKAIACLRIATLPVATMARNDAYWDAARTYSEKAICAKIDELVKRGYLEVWGKQAGGLTTKGLAALEEAMLAESGLVS